MSALDILLHNADAVLLFLPLVAGVLLTAAPAGRATSALSATVACSAAVLSLVVVARMLGGGAPEAMDALAAGALAVAAVVAAGGFLAAVALAPKETPKRTRAIALGLGLVVAGASFGAIMERDLLRIVLLLQTATLAAAALTALSVEKDRRAGLAAFGAVMVTLGAGALSLTGAAMLFASSGSLDIADVATRIRTSGAAGGAWLGAAFLLAGFGVFAGLAPVHGSAAAVTARVSHAASSLVGIVVRLAAFIALTRVYAATQSFASAELAQAFAYGVAAFGALSLVVGGLQAIASSDARRLAAHALTAQFGCALVGLAAGGDDGVIAALFVAAAGAMTALALLVGAAVARVESASAPMATLDGLGRTHPFVAAAVTVAALGMTGAPLTASFLGKWLSIEAALSRGWYWAAAAIVASAFAAVFVAGQIIERLYFRERAVTFGVAPRTPWALAPALSLSVLATVVFGWNAAAPLEAARLAASVLAPTGAAAP